MFYSIKCLVAEAGKAGLQHVRLCLGCSNACMAVYQNCYGCKFNSIDFGAGCALAYSLLGVVQASACCHVPTIADAAAA